jgi:hypothetical protein
MNPFVASQRPVFDSKPQSQPPYLILLGAQQSSGNLIIAIGGYIRRPPKLQASRRFGGPMRS